METLSVKFYTLSYKEFKTYFVALLFMVGNILLPQLFHLVPQGGITWLPIYFFTLVGAYKYGWKVGILTAVLSPVVNSILFGMPALAVLPVIVIKSSLLAVTAGMAAQYFRRISIPILIGVVLSYQITGTLFEWVITGSLVVALQDFRIGIPGMLLQVLGGYLFTKYFIKK